MVTPAKQLAAFFLLCLVLLAVSVHAAEIKVFVNQGQLQVDQSFQLVFEASGSVDDDPDFTPLKQDFDILGRNLSRSTRFVNGTLSSKKTWILSLLAKRSGRLEIPAIAFGEDKSPPLSLTIGEADTATASDENKEIYLDIEVEPKSVYPQQQATVRVRLFRRVEITNATLSEPDVSGEEAIVEKIGEDRNYDTIVNGRRYLVVERSYALFPQQSGRLEIAAFRFTGQLIQNQRSFFGPLTQAGPVRRIESDPLQLDVKPIPESFTGKTWLPAEELSVSDEWSMETNQLAVGEPVTRTLVLNAAGVLPSQLPQLRTGELTTFKSYPNQPKLQSDFQTQLLQASRQQKTALVPTKPGQFSLPEQSLQWWNTQTDQPEKLVIPGRTLNVTEAAIAGSSSSESELPPEQPPAADQQTETIIVDNSQSEIFWRILAGACALGWFITLLLWWRTKTGRTDKDTTQPQTEPPANLARTQQLLKTACATNNAGAASKALLQWGQLYWPANPPCNLAEIGRRTNNELTTEIERLSLLRYGESGESWTGNELWRVFRQIEIKPAARLKAKSGQLEDLYLD